MEGELADTRAPLEVDLVESHPHQARTSGIFEEVSSA